jgi:putative hemolysin
MTAQIIIVLVLILINGLFAMSEIVIVSSRKTRLQQWANEGSASPRRRRFFCQPFRRV